METTQTESVRGNLPLMMPPARRDVSMEKSQPPAASERAPEPRSRGEVESGAPAELATALNELASAMNVRIAFLVDQATGKTVIKVIDQETQEVIRQIPPEEMLRLVARMSLLLGVLLNQEA